MQILITGGTGLIGRHLIPRLLTLGHQVTVVTRNPDNARQILDSRVTLWKGLAEREHLNEIDAIINLAGEPIADKRWTSQQKERLCQSRWAITQKLVDLIHASATPPSVLISGSATGYYGDLGDVVVTEDEPPHNEFTHKLCARWEQIACRAQSDQTRVCLLRTGVVLAPQGGILGKWFRRFASGSAVRWVMVDNIWPGFTSTIWSTASCGCWITIFAVPSIWSRRIPSIMSILLMRWVARCAVRRLFAFRRRQFAY